jgi:hypothetical protein
VTAAGDYGQVLSAEQVDAQQEARAATAWLLAGPPTDRALAGWGIPPSMARASVGDAAAYGHARDLSAIEEDAPAFPDGTVPVAGQPGVQYVPVAPLPGTLWEQAQADLAADPNPERFILAAEASEDRRRAA